MAKRTRKIRKPDYGKQNIKAKFPKLYPTIYCTAEKMYIAVSIRPLPSYMKSVIGPNGVLTKTIEYKKRITYDYYDDWCCKWRDDKYKIDMRQFNVGDLVRCPVCKCEVDFRVFPSDTVPEFSEVESNDKASDIKELPSAQGEDV